MKDPMSGRKVVTTAGTAEPLSEVPFTVAQLDIFALDANIFRVYVGDHAVSGVLSNEQGLPLSAKEQVTFEGPVDLANIWIDAVLSGEGVSWIARIGQSFTTSA